MAGQNPLLDDLAGLMTGAMGAARSAGEEVQTAMRSQAARFVADMDLATREDIEVLKALLAAAIGRIETLEMKIEAMSSESGDSA